MRYESDKEEGFFKRNVDRFFGSKKRAGITLGALFGLVAAADSFEIVTEREVGLRIQLGQVLSQVSNGIVFKVPFIQHIQQYPLTIQEITTGDSGFTLRTADQQRVIGGLRLHFVINEEADVRELFYNFRNNYESVLRAKLIEVAIAVFGEQTSINLTSNLTQINATIKERLQAQLDATRLPFTIRDVIQTGIGLHPSADATLNAIAQVQQQATLLELRERLAIRGQEVARQEAQVTANLIQGFRSAGVAENQLPTVLCLHWTNAAGRNNEPLAAGCFGPGVPMTVTLPGQQRPTAPAARP